MAGHGFGHGGHHGVGPAANAPFGNPLASNHHLGGHQGTGPIGSSASPGFNGGHADHIRHVAARPAFGRDRATTSA